MIRHNRREVTLNQRERKLSDRFNELLSEGHGIAHAAMLTFTEYAQWAPGHFNRPGSHDRLTVSFVSYLSEHTVRINPLTGVLSYADDAPVNDGCDEFKVAASVD